MNFDFTGKVVIVTGSSSGIGEDAVITFAQLGAQVVVTGRNAERVDSVAKLCDSASPSKLKALQIVGDVSKDADAKRLIAVTVEKFGRLDVLVNNAGVMPRADLASENVIEVLDTVYRVNVRSLILLTHLAAPHLIATKGNIINVSSVASTMVSQGGLAYSCSKAAVDMATKSLAVELTPKGVRVNAINPAMIDTPLAEHSGIPAAAFAVYKTHVQSIYPSRRVGTVKDTTAAIIFLASDHASFLTGMKMPVDGGYLSTSANAAISMTSPK